MQDNRGVTVGTTLAEGRHHFGENTPHMKTKTCIALAWLLDIATNVAVAHPGPHTHHDNTTLHSYLGWETLLMLAVVAAGVIVWRWFERQH